MQDSGTEAVQQVILAQNTNPLGGIIIMSTMISKKMVTLGSCIFKADFKILFRNFTKYLRYCAAVDHKIRRKP